MTMNITRLNFCFTKLLVSSYSEFRQLDTVNNKKYLPGQHDGSLDFRTHLASTAERTLKPQ